MFKIGITREGKKEVYKSKRDETPELAGYFAISFKEYASYKEAKTEANKLNNLTEPNNP